MRGVGVRGLLLLLLEAAWWWRWRRLLLVHGFSLAPLHLQLLHQLDLLRVELPRGQRGGG